MEKALRYELNKIAELNNKIFPTNAPEGQESPYLVYMSNSSSLKDLDGIKNNVDSDVLLNVLCKSYSEMKDLSKKVKALIKTFPLKVIGNDGPYIEDLTIDTITETYENELKLYRGIIPFRISYKEE